MKILIACESSQTVCKAFREKGHIAFSCDITPCYGGYPEWHIMGDCLEIINGYVPFYTQDQTYHKDVIHQQWDMVIAHPPCTYLSKAGACNLFDFYGKIKDTDRYLKGVEASKFFLKVLSAKTPRLCVENPVPIKLFKLPSWTQIIQPYFFGDPYSKATCLWLKGLPPLQVTNLVESNVEPWCKLHSSPRLRSKTFTGIALAMAEQWTEEALPYQLSFDI